MTKKQRNSQLHSNWYCKESKVGINHQFDIRNTLLTFIGPFRFLLSQTFSLLHFLNHYFNYVRKQTLYNNNTDITYMKTRRGCVVEEGTHKKRP